MMSNKQSAAKVGEHPSGSSAGPGVVQQHVFKNITTHSLTNEVKSYNSDTGITKL